MKTIFRTADILIPQESEMEKWSVVACDQFNAQPEYWENVDKLVGDAPSTLRLMVPECYYGEKDMDERAEKSKEKMREYAKNLCSIENSYIYIERTLANGTCRRGIVGALDLEEYDYSKGSKSPIRATEGVVMEKIPSRVKLRRNALLEMPHVMVLIDDAERSIIEPFGEKKEKLPKLYDFELMENGGHICGWRISGEEAECVEKAFDKMAQRFEAQGRDILIAVGDGNHSLVTAKTCWEEIKKDLSAEEAETHPARFALVELGNIWDESLEFLPINRVIFDTDAENMEKEFKAFFEKPKDAEGGHKITFVCSKKTEELHIDDSKEGLAVVELMRFLDYYLAKFPGRVDFVHGDDVTARLASQENCCGFILSALDKSELFPSISANGVLPKKTFSMGEANDKRYYLECHKIMK